MRPMALEANRLRGLVPALAALITAVVMAPSLKAGGAGLPGPHALGLALHCANAALTCWLVLELLRAGPTGRDASGPAVPLWAGAAALFFSIHPLRVELIVSEASRSQTLSAMFLLFSTASYLRAADPAAAGNPRRAWLAASLLAYAGSLKNGPAGLLFPAVLLVLDAVPLGRLSSDSGPSPARSRALVEKVPFVLLAALFAALALSGRGAAGTAAVLERPDGLARSAAAVYAAVFYLEKTLLPFHLSPLYEVQAAYALRMHPFDPLVLPRTLVLSAAGLCLLFGRRRHPAVSAAGAAYLALILPVSGLVPHGPFTQIAAHKWFYLAAVPWAVLVAGLLSAPSPREGSPWSGWRPVSAGAVLLLCAALSWRQARLWAHPEDLWVRGAENAPPCGTCRLRAAEAFIAKGEFDAAAAQCWESISSIPSIEAHLTRAYAYARAGRPEVGEGSVAAAADIDSPKSLHYSIQKGLEHLSRDEFRDAVIFARFAVRIDPASAVAHNNLGYALQRQGDVDGAVLEFEASLRQDPGLTLAANNLRAAMALKSKQTSDGARASSP